jgi:hypothetical protein
LIEKELYQISDLLSSDFDGVLGNIDCESHAGVIVGTPHFALHPTTSYMIHLAHFDHSQTPDFLVN